MYSAHAATTSVSHIVLSRHRHANSQSLVSSLALSPMPSAPSVFLGLHRASGFAQRGEMYLLATAPSSAEAT